MLLGKKYKEKIKRTLFRNYFFHRIVTGFNIMKIKKKIDQVEKEAREIGIVLYGPECVQKKHQKSKICHIVGSGWSVEESKKIISSQPKDFVIGFNFSCLLGVKFDIYMLEFGGQACKEIAASQKKAFDRFVNKNNTTTLFKNLWEDKNDIKYAYNLYGDDVYYVRDISIPCFHERYLPQSISKLFEKNVKYFMQFKSTVTTCISVARYLGFKEIVLHGIDFGGGYFFDRAEYNDYELFKPPVGDNSHAYRASIRAKDSVHPTAASASGVKNALPVIREKLLEEGISLYCASSSSPCAKVLPVFKGE